MGIVIMMIIVASLFFIIKTALKNSNQSQKEDNSTNNRQYQAAQQEDKLERLDTPSYACYYYELVGMKYRGLNSSDMGIHDGYAIAENNNKHDKYAVGIYRKDNGKLIAYVPKDFQGKSNKVLHDELSAKGRAVEAHFRIWQRGENIYGCAYIGTEGIPQQDL